MHFESNWIDKLSRSSQVIQDNEEDIEKWLPAKVYADGQTVAVYHFQCFMTRTPKRKPALRVIVYYVACYSNGIPKWRMCPVDSITSKAVPRRQLVSNP